MNIQQEVQAEFDYIDGMLYRKHSHGTVKQGDKFGTVVPAGYIEGFFKNKKTSLHVLVWQWHNGEIPEGYIVDHKDRNKLNCKIDNLRLATASQNQANRGVNYNSTTGIKGLQVTTQRGYTYYVAKITANGKRLRKTFKYTEEGKELAIAWLQEQRQKLHGEFACDN